MHKIKLRSAAELKLYLRHKLTAYHWRYNRRGNNTTLAICDCGWHYRMFRQVKWQSRRRSLLLGCWLRGHAWGETEEIHTGLIGFEKSEETFLGAYRQCERCWKTEDV